MEVIHSINTIVSNPHIRNGRPCIAGTGLRVTDIVIPTLFHRRSPDAIASDFDLPIAQVYAALAYYYEHKSELDEEIRIQIAKAASYKQQMAKNGTSSLLS